MTAALRGELFILSAPSGSGKTTLIRGLLEGGLAKSGDLAFSVSHTTREKRAGEQDGRDYHFVSHDAFNEMIAGDGFLEWEQVHHNYYGTSRAEVVPRLEAGIDVLMDIDVKGAERMAASCPEAHTIFVMPPSYEALSERLRHRASDHPEEITRRLAVSLWEIRRYEQYHYVIVNDDADQASEVLAAIILEKRHRRDRMRSRVENILQSFQDRAG
jgi:guanylate kinase